MPSSNNIIINRNTTTSAATSAARAAAKHSTFRGVGLVVLVGIFILIWFLATESEDGHRAAHDIFLRGWGTAVDDEQTVREGEGGADYENDDTNGNHNNNIDPLKPRQPPTEPKYYFELDKPRREDEANFFHLPRSQGGVLHVVPDNRSWTDEMRETAKHLHTMFALFDENETDTRCMPVYGTMCVGRDCVFIPSMIAALRIAIGHFIVVVNTDDRRWTNLFSAMQDAFPGRFSAFIRPEKLSCAESWNLVVRMGFSIRPTPPMIFIANADWRPKDTEHSTAKTANGSAMMENNMARFCEWAHLPENLDLVVLRYFHFSSFVYTKKGFLALGYFDEQIFPALAEDVEFHLRAVSAGLGKLGLYDRWHAGSVHVTRASVGDASSRVIDQRNARVARNDYIWRKWNVRVGSVRDYAIAFPFSSPFNISLIRHNNSWVVDPVARKCALTDEGPKMPLSKRCYWNATVLRKLLPEEIKETFAFDERLTTMDDAFPDPSFF